MRSIDGVGARLRRPHADVFVGVAVVLFAAIVYAATFSFDQAPFEISQGMGAETFPRLVLGVMATLGAALAWRSRRRRPEPAAPVAAIVIQTAVLLLLFMIAGAVVGMLPAMFFFIVALGVLWGERRIVPLCILAAAMCLAIWAVFARGLSVPLPAGMLGQLRL